MTHKPIARSAFVLAALSALAIAPGAATAANPEITAAIKSLEAMPADSAKFTAYCNVLGEMEQAPDGDQAKFDALEDKLEAAVAAYGADMAKAWDVLSEVDPDTDDGKAVAAAFEAVEEKCP